MEVSIQSVLLPLVEWELLSVKLRVTSLKNVAKNDFGRTIELTEEYLIFRIAIELIVLWNLRHLHRDPSNFGKMYKM